MDVKEFAKYVVNNMHRATLSNALNISNKLDKDGFYKFTDFLTELQLYINECIKQNRIEVDKCYAILYLLNTTISSYNAEFNYNKIYIIDDFLIELWKILDKGI